MTSLAAISSLTAGGTDIQQNPIGIFFEIVMGINELPTVRGKDLVVPGRDGRFVTSRRADTLPLELAGIVIGLGSDVAAQQASYRTLMQIVRATFDRAQDPWELAGTLEDGSTATISVRCVDMKVTETAGSMEAKVMVALESVDPDWVIV